MAKYRIVRQDYSNGKVRYSLQRKVLGLFWRIVRVPVALGTELQIFSTLEQCKRAYTLVTEPDARIVKEYVIKCGDEES